MKEISCDIIRDILPLYVDQVVSEDTKELVEEHLQECEECAREAEAMKKTLILPANRSVKKNDAEILKDLRNAGRTKK